MIFIVDDDAGVLKALARRLSIKGYAIATYASPRAFLADHDPTVPGCAVLDVSMPNLNGLELQQALRTGVVHRPVIFLTGKPDIPTSVRAMKAGAIDFLTKPVNDAALLEAIARAERQDEKDRQAFAERDVMRSKIATLTPREREVLTHVVAGRLNKQIAGDLGTVEQTIKVHRRRMMEKLGARSLLELARMVERVGIAGLDPPYH